MGRHASHDAIDDGEKIDEDWEQIDASHPRRGAEARSARELFGRARWASAYTGIETHHAAGDDGEGFEQPVTRSARRQAGRQQHRDIRGDVRAERRQYLKRRAGPTTRTPAAVPIALAVIVAGIALWSRLRPQSQHSTSANATSSSHTPTTSTSGPARPLRSDQPSASQPSAAGGGPALAGQAPAQASATSVDPLAAPSTATGLTPMGIPDSSASAAESAAVAACSYSYREPLLAWRARIQRWLTDPTQWAPDAEDQAQWDSWVIPHQVISSCTLAGLSTDDGGTATQRRYMISLAVATTSTEHPTSTAATYAAVTQLQPDRSWLLSSLSPQ